MKKGLFFLGLVTCLTIALIALLSINITNAAPIFSDGFESGNLNNWTPFSGMLFIDSQTVNRGVYSAQCIISGSTENLYFHVLDSPLSTIDFREYVYVNSTVNPSTSGDYYQVGGFSSTLGGNMGNGGIFVFNSGGTLYWGLYYRNNGTFYQAISSSAVSTGWCYVEMQYVSSSGSSSNGEEHLWLNGVDIRDVTGISNNDRNLANAVIGGSQKVTYSVDTWNYYIDDVVVSSSYIGPTPSSTTVPTANPTLTPSSAAGPTSTVTLSPTTTATATFAPFQSSSVSGSPTPSVPPLRSANQHPQTFSSPDMTYITASTIAVMVMVILTAIVIVKTRRRRSSQISSLDQNEYSEDYFSSLR